MSTKLIAKPRTGVAMATGMAVPISTAFNKSGGLGVVVYKSKGVVLVNGRLHNVCFELIVNKEMLGVKRSLAVMCWATQILGM